MTRSSDSPAPVSLVAVLAITLLGSVSTGVFWNAISFIAKHGYDFSEERNAVLYTVMGVVYATGAFTSGRMTRRVSRYLSVRGVLLVSLGGQAVSTLLPWIDPREWTLWASSILVSYLTSMLWPIVESYLVSGRHGREMRSAIGWFNIAWMLAVALPLLAMASFLESNASKIVPAVTVINVLALIPALTLPRRPGAHDMAETVRHVGDEYPLLRRSAQLLLPASYVLIAAVTPVVPYRFEALDVAASHQTPITATWMLVRVAVVIVMWRLAFWHGRWGTLLAGGGFVGIGFTVLIMAPSVPVMVVGFASFGLGLGMIYYAALYYAMSVGQAEVDAGGMHEGLIGLGYTAGPMAVMLGYVIHALMDVSRTWSVVGMVGLLFLIASIVAMIPYLHARRRRAAGRDTLRS